MNKHSNKNNDVLRAFKALLAEHQFCSQQALIKALAHNGFEDISQAKVSRMLAKVGAVKIRNEKNEMVYQLPNEANTPQTKQSINSMVLKVKHNNVHIVVKTILGGGSVIARILDTMGESCGILATIADENAVLVIPTDINRTEDIAQKILNHLELAEVH